MYDFWKGKMVAAGYNPVCMCTHVHAWVLVHRNTCVSWWYLLEAMLFPNCQQAFEKKCVKNPPVREHGCTGAVLILAAPPGVLAPLLWGDTSLQNPPGVRSPWTTVLLPSPEHLWGQDLSFLGFPEKFIGGLAYISPSQEPSVGCQGISHRA